MSIKINVINQKMSILNHPDQICPTMTINDITEGSQNFVKFYFTFTDEWNGLVKFVQFMQEGTPYNVFLDDENSASLPPEIKPGTCTMMVYGSYDSIIGTTNYIKFRVNENFFVSDASSTDISQTLYDQLITKFVNIENKVDNLYQEDFIISEIKNAVQNEMKEYLESGKLSEMIIEDGSITKSKLSEDALLDTYIVTALPEEGELYEDFIVKEGANYLLYKYIDGEWRTISAPSTTGVDGKSAYEVAVDNGFEGTESEWLSSLKGATGDSGERGDRGSIWYPTNSNIAIHKDTTSTMVTIRYTEIGSGAGTPDASMLNLFATLDCDLTIGTQYKVDFDGDIYDCECFKASTGSPALGSESLISGSGSITYPFFVIQEYGGTFCAASDTENSHTITIYEPSENSLVDIEVAEVDDLIFSTTTNDLFKVTNKFTDYYESDNKKKIDISITLRWLSFLKGNDGTSVSIKETTVTDTETTITFSDGNSIIIKNGTQGVPGQDGKRGSIWISSTQNIVFDSEEVFINEDDFYGHISGYDIFDLKIGDYVIFTNTCDVAEITDVIPMGFDVDEIGISVKFIANIKGKDGITPEKGADYWTPEDKLEIINEVISSFVDVSEVGQ